ncbi:MAG: DNA polymerase III subunit gamma/tau [Desulfobacterales bacterium]|nr:DNA polymerase III subunit gamma/tau [Desulfobacterales bacterium]
MSYLVLARKYRPQTFGEVVKQEHITRTLTHAISSGRVAHAILFSGPRGTGKTTVARILAKSMNCKTGPTPVPCNDCRSCREITSGNGADVFEIDGASNNSVDQIRDLRDNVKYMPAHSPYKIYIIDEVHMLSIAAFNALLKTLEEPPSHVLFFFATTEPRKIPITILSRCQRHDFRRIDVESISKHMQNICAKEAIDIDVESLALIARAANGSMRDGLSLLDQVMSCAKDAIEHDQVLDILGVVDRNLIFRMSDAVLKGNVMEILDILDQVYGSGHDMKKLYADLIEHFRNLLIVKMGEKGYKLLDIPSHEIDLMLDQTKNVPETFLNQIFDLLFKEEPTIEHASQPRFAIEMVFIRMFQIKPALPIDVLIEKLDILKKDLEEFPVNTKGIGSGPMCHDNENTSPAPSASPAEPVASDPGPLADSDDTPENRWDKLLSIFLTKYPSLATNLKHSNIKKISGKRLEIEVNGNDFNLTMVKKEKNVGIIKKVCSEFFGREMDVIVRTKKIMNTQHQRKHDRTARLRQEALSHPLVTDALEIFNGNLVDVKIL